MESELTPEVPPMPEAQLAPEPVVEAPAPEPVPEPASSVVGPRIEAAPEPEVPFVPNLTLKLLLPNIARKHVEELSETTFRLKESKLQHVVQCLQAGYSTKSVQVSDDQTTISVGDEHKVTFVVENDMPYILLACLDSVEDNKPQMDMNVALFKVLTQ